MRASELVEKLNALIEEYGDLEVLYSDIEEENIEEVEFRKFKCLSNDFFIS